MSGEKEQSLSFILFADACLGKRKSLSFFLASVTRVFGKITVRLICLSCIIGSLLREKKVVSFIIGVLSWQLSVEKKPSPSNGPHATGPIDRNEIKKTNEQTPIEIFQPIFHLVY